MDQAESTALLTRARGGSNEALNTLFTRYAGKLLGLIRLRMGHSLRSHVESRDILNASLLKAFQQIERFESSETKSLMAWLARIAENEIRDQADYHGRQLRDAARVVPLEQGVAGLADRVRSQISGIILTEELESLERALESLNQPHREVILLRKFEELSFGEIGQRLGKSPDACRMLLARALTALTIKTQELS